MSHPRCPIAGITWERENDDGELGTLHAGQVGRANAPEEGGHRGPPCFFGSSRRDHALLPTLLDGLDALAPDLRIHRVPEGSHWLTHEAPERVAALIRTFADEAPR